VPNQTIIRRTSKVTEQSLRRKEEREERRKDRPSELPLDDIAVADGVFQWRLPEEEMLADERFVQELVDALEVQEKPLRPLEALLVTPIGDQFFLVDGHHRLDAYATFGWSGHVPVEVFEGDLREAKREAWSRNARNKLPMTKASRFEAAWKFIKDGSYTRNEITRLTSVRRSTLTTMRGVLTEFGDRARVLPWVDARRLGPDEERQDNDTWKEAAAREIARHMAKGPSQTSDPELLGLALRMVRADLPASLVAEWPDEIEKAVLSAARDTGGDALEQEAEGLLRQLYSRLAR
jgi:hypothetical protein